MSTSFGDFEPMPLQQWFIEFDDFARQGIDKLTPDEKVVIDHQLRRMTPQVMFVRDVLGPLFFSRDERMEGDAIQCVGLHRSKSVLLPVYRLNIPGIGTIQMRYNFYNWVVSCDLTAPLWTSLDNVFDEHQVVPTTCAEGFQDDEVYGSYSADQRKFTVILGPGEHGLYFLLRLIKMHVHPQGIHARRSA